MQGFNKNPDNAADPWLPGGASETRGNNVDAYADDDTPDGFSPGDVRAGVTMPGEFGHRYDTTLGPVSTPEQTLAAVTQLFYTSNWLHDWYYDSGFNEAAGNAQTDNFGRGGIGGDALRAEAQDAVLVPKRNNANMTTPADGIPPRMQMYLWSGKGTHSLHVQPLDRSLVMGTASFGPQQFDLTGELRELDGAMEGDGCGPIVADMAGAIALLDRGECPATQQVVNAQRAGASGVILVNKAPNVQALRLAGADPEITVPVVSVSLEDGRALEAALLSGPLTATMTRGESGVERDGSIDNHLIAHEWGHYLHHRLVECGSPQCRAQSEGWADFVAMHLSIREGEDLDGTFALGGYSTAALGDSGYFGIRRAPYSVDFSKNAFTFRHISDGEALPVHPRVAWSANNYQVHNAGEIWASMLFEAYIALLKESRGPSPRYTFDQARRRMSDYIVAGMKLAPVDPTFTEQRDAILAAAYASEPRDMDVLARAFARRGAGNCAVSPSRRSTEMTGVVESFSIQPSFAYVDARFDDGGGSCDEDGHLDADETGSVTVEVLNSGITPLTGTTVTLTSMPGVVFPGGPTATFGTIEPFAVGAATIPIGLDASFTSIAMVELNVAITNPAACTATTNDVLLRQVNLDEIANATLVDTVESTIVAWTITGAHGSDAWSRGRTTSTNNAWLGVDLPRRSDTQLESPDLTVSDVEPLIMTFEHRHSFGGSLHPPIHSDGAVVEITRDNGASWVDIRTYADPGYNDIVGSDSPLAKRHAFVDRNPAWPSHDMVALKLGMALAGETIKVRFRIGTDTGTGHDGWEIDNIVFLGITNKPFPTLVSDAADCGSGPGMPANGGGCSVARGGPATFALASLLAAAAAALLQQRRTGARRGGLPPPG